MNRLESNYNDKNELCKYYQQEFVFEVKKKKDILI